VKFRLQAGAELDLLTEAELRGALDDARQAFAADLAADRGRTIRAGDMQPTSAAGYLLLQSVYRVPAGLELALHRLLVTADGYTPAAPYTNANGYLQVLRSGEVVDFTNLTGTGSIPILSTDPDSQASRFRNGETIDVELVGGPASTRVKVLVQGWLSRPAIDRRD
jgi:hypothetical protein